MSFRDDFVWGAAAASYQIEGAWNADGKGPNVWDMFARTPGKVWSGHTGDVACDHYHRYREDVALMAGLGLDAYRLSISWARVLPDGVGAVNEKGLAFYDALVDELLAAGVRPYVTLFHWDYPYELFCRGGWLNRASSDWFAEYTGVIVDRLSDRVRHWMTLNEPQCFIQLGHGDGLHAPGLKLGFAELLRATHNVLLAHGKAVQTIRARSKLESEVGFAPVGGVCIPATDSEADVDAARRMMFSITDETLFTNTWWSDPVVLGYYPDDGRRLFGAKMPRIAEADMDTILQPLDSYGVNIYQGTTVRAGKNGEPEVVPHPDGFPHTLFYWPVTPAALYWGPRFLQERYGLPVYITENGLSCPDWPAVDGQVRDPQRIDFLTRYLRELRRAAADGVDVRGYFQWSILDNFEWAEGYKQRFGLVHVDYPTGTRTPKESARWYAEVIASNGENLAGR